MSLDKDTESDNKYHNHLKKKGIKPTFLHDFRRQALHDPIFKSKMRHENKIDPLPSKKGQGSASLRRHISKKMTHKQVADMHKRDGVKNKKEPLDFSGVGTDER